MKSSEKIEQLKQKQRLHYLKTQHDESAKINQSLLYEETKNFYKNQVAFSIYADSKADQLFSLKPVDIGFVQSLTLKEDPKFKQVKHLLQKYNDQVLQYNQKSSPGLHLKTKVIESMLKFMRLMMLAPDATAKKRILDVAYYWFKKNLESQKGQKRTKQSLEKQIRQILTSSNIIPQTLLDRQLPSQKRKQQLSDYFIKARTKYAQLNAPHLELQNFVTHKLGFANHQQKNQNHLDNSKKTQQELRQQNWKKKVIFKKPFLEQPNYDEIQLDKMMNEQQKISENHLQTQKTDLNLSQFNIQNKDRDSLPAEQNTQQKAQLQPQTEGQELDLGIADEADEQQDQQEPDEQGKKIIRGKLDPLVKIFLRDRQRKLKTEGEISADKQYYHVKNLKLNEQRLDQINANFMTQWAGKRSRFKSELSRKIQSIRAFASVTQAKQQVPLNHLRVENTINKAKLNQTLKQYKSYLHNNPIIKDKLNTELSMSVFDRKRTKTEVSPALKLFSAVLEDNKRIDQKSLYMQEIHKLKEKFSKYKVYTPFDNLKKAIIHPEQKQCLWYELQKDQTQGIELSRCQMLSNPFIKVAKKKKKKGKKK